MLISYSKKFNIRILRKICKIKCIKFVSQLNKLKLIKILNEFNAVKIIQQCFRRKTIIDNYCPISHESLKYPFISLKVNNKFFYYDFYTLVTYLNKSQDFREPCTRQLISDSKLLEINKNGTATFLLTDGRLILSYQSGYVRIDNKKSDRLYQINKVKRVPNKYYPHLLDSERILIPNELDRLQYIINWVKRNVK